jgi:hypothetical protein
MIEVGYIVGNHLIVNDKKVHLFERIYPLCKLGKDPEVLNLSKPWNLNWTDVGSFWNLVEGAVRW